MEENLPTPVEYRNRITREDDLLNTRTMVFLVTSGLMMTAVGFSHDVTFRLVVSVLGTVLTFLWIMLSWQNQNVIKTLTKKYRKAYPDDLLENLVQGALFKAGWKRPNDLIAIPIPIIFLITWVVFIVINSVE